MVDSTAMTQRVGDDRSRELHSAHDLIVRRALDLHRGTTVRHTGDGMMASFGITADALACAVEIQRRIGQRNLGAAEPLELRIGVVAGEIVEDKGEFLGSGVQLVTRVAARAQGGQILVSEAIRELASGKGFVFGSSRSVALKGFADRVRVHELVWSA
jgi:class 3 adenylate cyclase